MTVIAKGKQNTGFSEAYRDSGGKGYLRRLNNDTLQIAQGKADDVVNTVRLQC